MHPVTIQVMNRSPLSPLPLVLGVLILVLLCLVPAGGGHTGSCPPGWR